MSSNLTDEAKKLSVAERIVLVEEIWDSIAEDNGCFELSESQKKKLIAAWRLFRLIPHKVEAGTKSKPNSSTRNDSTCEYAQEIEVKSLTSLTFIFLPSAYWSPDQRFIRVNPRLILLASHL